MRIIISTHGQKAHLIELSDVQQEHDPQEAGEKRGYLWKIE
jgi:hypothetical protein